MKKILFFLSPILFGFLACDKVEDPIVKKTEVIGSKFVTNTNSAVSNSKKVLLEDYTGQTCPNCPTAARTISNDLVPTYSTNLVVIAVHQGATFAKPVGTFTNDFRTTAGEAWGATGGGFGINFWPAGLVNRKNYGFGMLTSNTTWASIIPIALKDPFVVKLDVTTEYDTLARALNVKVKGTFQTAFANPLKIVAVYTQDGIVGKQKDGSKDIEEYEFEHVMCGDINGAWGTDFTTAAAVSGQTVSTSMDNFALPTVVTGTSKTGNTAIKDRKVTVVVFVYDVTNKTVIQAEAVKIRP